MPVAFAEGAITHLRRERKVRLDPGEGDEIWDRVRREIPGVPMGPTVVTTVYFDGPGHPLARRARETPSECTKVRAKHYDPDREGDGSRVVLEVKRELGGMSSKERVWVPRPAARSVLAGDCPFRLPLREAPFAPVVAVRYRRDVFQTSASWRVTLDRELSFHPAGWSALERGRLAPPFARDESAILELKYLGDGAPEWLVGLVTARAGPFSKFVHAMDRLRERGPAEA